MQKHSEYLVPIPEEKSRRPSEGTRSRELYRYYSPPSNFDEQLESRATDTVLFAFAQLTALKLHVKRALISLIDSTTQYIVAESSQKLIPHLSKSSSKYTPDSLIQDTYEVQVYPRFGRLCEKTLDLFEDVPPGQFNTFEIEDLTADPLYQEIDFVKGSPYMRFYAGAPIRTSKGLNIGTLCLLDDRPRKLSEEEKATLVMMADVVMSQLETIRRERKRSVGVRMQNNLGKFVAGGAIARRQAPGWKDGNEGSVKTMEKKSFDDRPPPFIVTKCRTGKCGPAEPDIPLFSPRSPGADVSRPIESKPLPEALEPQTDLTAESEPVSCDSIPMLDASFLASRDSPDTYARASNLIKEAMGVDEVIFVKPHLGLNSSLLDGPGGYFTHSTCSGKPPVPPGSSLWSEEESRLTPCIGQGQATSVAGILEEIFLQQLLIKYPCGTIFNHTISYSNYRQFPPKINGTNGWREVDLSIEERAISSFLKLAPHSTSSIFFPLYDTIGKVSSLGFVFTNNPARVFNSAELGYLGIFGNAIMAEVKLLNMISADNAKSRFISSISHELRSPLHGILAGTELLFDTVVNAQQRELLGTIENCGRTLLDTLNHVLEFSTLDIAAVRDFPRHSSSPRSKPMETGHGSGISNFDQNSEGIAKGEKVVIDLTGLVEEVIQVVVAGYGFKPTNFETLNKEASEVQWKTLSGDQSNGNLKRTLTLNKDIVPIVLDIEQRDSWLYQTQSAAFRRILMNLLGNALKYTNRGFVYVKLSIQQPNQLISLSEGNEKVDLVTLTVEDTGKGMKQEFLSEGLFAAFSQEDHLSPGTGLGMAIVNLLVKSLGGTITVQSSLGEGTKFTVTLPLQCGNSVEVLPAPDLIITPKMGSTFDETRIKTMGKRVSMLGFNSPTGDKLQLRKLEVMSKSLRAYLENWFGMTVVPYTNKWRTESDLFIIRYSTETSAIIQTLAGNNPVLVLHADSSKIISSTSAWVKSLSTPCGPNNLAKMFDVLLQDGCARKFDEAGYIAKVSLEDTGDGNLDGQIAAEATSRPHTLTLDTEMDMLTIASPTGEPIKPPPVSSIAEVKSESPRILVVDDNPINQMVLVRYLKKRNYFSSKAENGLIAFNAVKTSTKPYNIILMDLQMPIMNGFDSTIAIRKLELEENRAPATIIALTGLDAREDRKKAIACGINVFLTKPVSLSQVQIELDKWESSNNTK
ncbi:hypothetical protein L873DRAFT_1786566 [Choiromyces venosus 120613-1]|uniref:histidine kinase n=1 Tax=Choiromyces venosus 120613-1 TaxID=1336337 RepID=A0A3N4K0X7_9PEZI|nr:hypothetical protein L873DRAFT_1786566 [Choiromyces venosus 120613-1]